MGLSRNFLNTLLFFGSMVLAKGSDDATCGTYGGYLARPDGRFRCVLYDTNWAKSKALEITYRHCLKTPTVNLFVRNFQGADEVNHDFVPAERTLRMKAYTGKTAKFKVSFTVVKGNEDKGIRKHLWVKLTFQPNSKAIKIENLITAKFYMDLTDDCNWIDRLEVFEKIFLGIGLSLALIAVVLLSFFIAKRRKRNNPKKYPPPPLMTHL